MLPVPPGVILVISVLREEPPFPPYSHGMGLTPFVREQARCPAQALCPPPLQARAGPARLLQPTAHVWLSRGCAHRVAPPFRSTVMGGETLRETEQDGHPWGRLDFTLVLFPIRPPHQHMLVPPHQLSPDITLLSLYGVENKFSWFISSGWQAGRFPQAPVDGCWFIKGTFL